MNLRKTVSLAISLLLLSTVALAQGSATGDLHVIVKDPNGGMVTNATVAAREEAKGLERSTNVNAQGEYRIVALPPGNYAVTVDAPGFAKTTAEHVSVTVGQMAELPVALTIAGGREVVEVNSQAALVETTRTSSTDTIEQRRIDNLPINGRNYINFALTDSRLARDDTPSIGAAPTSGLNMSGQRARSNLVNVDGEDAVDNSVNGIRSTVSQEAVQEFQIQTAGYSAEYGRASGGVVNIVTRSGANIMHGTLFGYLRNRNFQAVNPFSTISNPAYTRVQTGADFGGAIKKDKTFYYFSWEGTWRQETGFSSIGANNFGLNTFDASAFLGLPAQSYVIQATQPQIAFLQSTAPGTPGTDQYVVLVGRSSGMALNGVWPGPPALGGGFNGFTTSCPTPPCFVPQSYVTLNSLIGNFPVTERTDLYSLRLDHNLSNNNRLMLRGAASPSDVTGIQVQAQGPQNFGQNAFSRTSTQNYHDWSISGQDQWTIGNNKINEFRFQYSRRGLLFGFSNFPGLSPVQAYGAGIPANFIQGVGNPHDAFSNTPLGTFMQDSWRIRPNLTVNYGVRYDVELTPQFGPLNALAKQGQDFLGITQGIPRDTNNVAPRIGLSWDPKGDGKSVVRASYGLFYDHPLLGLAFIADVADGAQAPQMVLFPGAPCSSSGSPSPLNLNASNTFQGLLPNASCTPPGLSQALNYLPSQQRFNPAPNAPSAFVNQAYLQAGVPLAIQPFGFPNAKNFQYAYSNQANLTFERELGRDLSLSVEYNFNGGRHLNRPINVNAVKPAALLANWRAARSDPLSGAATLGHLAVGSSVPCDPLNPTWVSAAMVSFFRPSGLNPSLANFLSSPAVGAGGCVLLAQQILAADGLNTKCDPSTLSGCVPFSDMPANLSSGSSVYYALTTNLRKRFGQHYEFLASYTWSHVIDDSTDLESPLEPQDNYTLAGERSNSIFDQRHRFVFSGVYQTGKLGGGGFVEKFLSGWTLAPIIGAVSGRPFNIISGTDTNFDFSTPTDRPTIVPANTPTDPCGNALAASRFSPTGFLQPACFLNGTLDGNLRRNAGTKPYDVFTDMRVSKRIPFGERLALEAAVDAFNFVNRFNVSDMNPLWNSAQKATAAFDPRQLQFALDRKSTRLNSSH